MSREDSVDLDAILAQLGQFGRYQIQTYCFILLPIMFSAVYNSQFIFAASATDHRLDFYKLQKNLLFPYVYIGGLFCPSFHDEDHVSNSWSCTRTCSLNTLKIWFIK